MDKEDYDDYEHREISARYKQAEIDAENAANNRLKNN
jgi:hypothetical protein